MSAIILIVLPVFGLIGIGYFLRLTNILGDRTGDGLSDFVFTVAVPALIIKTLTGAALPAAQPWGYWLAYFTGTALVWAMGMLIARKFFKTSHLDSVIAGFTAAQANTVLVGIPIILEAFGEEGAVPLFLLIAIHLPIMVTVATLLIDGRTANLLGVLKKLTHNPVVIAILAGGALKVAGITPSGPVKILLDSIAQAAVPCALIAMGVALRRYGIAYGVALPTILSALKIMVHPALVYALATKVFSMPPVWAGVAVLFASCPSGINAYLFAERYRSGVALTSSTIALSTLLSLFSTIFWLWWLGAGLK
ncbi:MAG: AEC family transporter [Beijerinckiaceae bacterium]